MQFFVPIPLPLPILLFFFPFWIMAKVVIWIARLFWRHVMPHAAYMIGWVFGYTKTKIRLARERMAERRELRRRAEKVNEDFERVEREVK